MTITARQLIESLLDDTTNSVDRLADLPMKLHILERKLNEAFGWQPIERAEAYGLLHVPAGKMWGPRTVVLLHDNTPMTHIAYWDLDSSSYPNERPYWRVLHKTPAWSRRHQPTHFLRTYAL